MESHYSQYSQFLSNHPLLCRSRYTTIPLAAALVLFLYTCFDLSPTNRLSNPFHRTPNPPGPTDLTAVLTTTSTYFSTHPLPASAFGELGHRTALLTTYLTLADALAPHLPPDTNTTTSTTALDTALNAALLTSFPYLHNPSLPHASTDFHTLQRATLTPFTLLRRRTRPGSAGIVIPIDIRLGSGNSNRARDGDWGGQSQFRATAHLIRNLRSALRSTLPIQLAHAG
ncbi:hypothetical protein AOQ84DRAFT_220282, partial [Glonium stellatum]